MPRGRTVGGAPATRPACSWTADAGAFPVRFAGCCGIVSRRAIPEHDVLTHADFATAVKDALRQYTRADLLAENRLLQARLLARRTPGPVKLQHLRQILTEAAEALSVNARDQKLFRALDLTYFNPAPKQEAAANRLGVPFGSYRRHLAAGVERITDWLWQQEQDALRAEEGAIGRPVTIACSDEKARQPNPRPRLSIVVLPFLNLSQESDLDYLVDGIVDSLTADLSRALPGSFVISRSTAFTYKGRQVPVRQVGQELRVRYVLEGSVLADTTRLRVNAQLVDALTDEHLWTERFDKDRRDVLEVQDEIVARLSRSIGIEMLRNEAERSGARTPEGMDAIDLVMRGNALAADVRRQENAAQVESLFRQALRLDPDNVDALVGLASICTFQIIDLYRLEERDRLLDEAEGLISRAFALAPGHIGVLKARAMLLRAQGRFGDAVNATQAVIAHNPGEPTAYREMGLNKLYLGATKEATEWFRRADCIAPRDPARWTWLQALGRALMQVGQDQEAAQVLRLAYESNPGWPRGVALLAAAEALVGHIERARQLLTRFNERDPGMTISRFFRERSSVPPTAVSSVYLRENEHILDGLRRAGMPEQ